MDCTLACIFMSTLIAIELASNLAGLLRSQVGSSSVLEHTLRVQAEDTAWNGDT